MPVLTGTKSYLELTRGCDPKALGSRRGKTLPASQLVISVLWEADSAGFLAPAELRTQQSRCFSLWQDHALVGDTAGFSLLLWSQVRAERIPLSCCGGLLFKWGAAALSSQLLWSSMEAWWVWNYDPILFSSFYSGLSDSTCGNEKFLLSSRNYSTLLTIFFGCSSSHLPCHSIPEQHLQIFSPIKCVRCVAAGPPSWTAWGQDGITFSALQDTCSLISVFEMFS